MALEIGAWFQRLLGKVEKPDAEKKKVNTDMTPKEAGEAMQTALRGERSEIDNSQMPKDNSVKDFEEKEKKEGKSLGSILGGTALVAGIAAVAGGLIGGIAGLFAGGVGVIPGILAGAKAGGILGGALSLAFGLSSCNKDKLKEELFNNTTNLGIENNIVIQINNDDLLEAINNLKAEVNAGNELLNEILTLLRNIQEGVIQITEQNQHLIDAITHLILTVGTNHTDLMGILTQILNKITEMDEHQMQNYTAILNAIAGMDENMQAQFTQMLQTLLAMDEHQMQNAAAIQNILLDILAKISQMEANQQQNAANVMQQLMTNNELLQQIYAAMQNMNANQQQWFQQILAQVMGMSGDIQALLNAVNQNNALLNQILTKLNNLNQTVQNGVVQILAKLDQIDEHNQAGFLAVINKLDGMDQNQQAAMLAILNKLDGMDQNQQASAIAILSQLGDILNAIHAGNIQLDNISNLIANLNITIPGVDLSVIETLLQQILNQEQQNGNVLNNIQENQTLIINTTNQLRDLMLQVVDNQEIQNDWLENIFNKIPTDIPGCNCDCERIIELLIQIDQHIQNGDWNHEGIDDEFDDILG